MKNMQNLASSNIKMFHVEANMECEWINDSNEEFNVALAKIFETIMNNEWADSFFTSPKLKYYIDEQPTVFYDRKVKWFELVEDGLKNEIAEFCIQTNPNIFSGMLEYHMFYTTTLENNNMYQLTLVGIFEDTELAHSKCTQAMDRVFVTVQNAGVSTYGN